MNPSLKRFRQTLVAKDLDLGQKVTGEDVKFSWPIGKVRPPCGGLMWVD